MKHTRTLRLASILVSLIVHGCGGTSDGGPPSLTVAIVTPLDAARVLGSRTIDVEGTLDATGTITEVTVAIGTGAPIAATFDQTSFTASVDLGDGSNAITVTATADDGANGNDAVTVVYPFVTLTSFQAASLELGQPDFTTGAAPGDPAIGIAYPYGHGSWVGDTLFAPSSDYNRILAFHGFPSRNGEPGDFVVGQPDLATTTAGSGASGMDFPQTVEGANGRLYVLDYSGSRLMGYDTPPTTSGVDADFAVGQADLATVATGCTQALTNYPDDFTIGGSYLFVSDRENHRILVWNVVPTTSGTPPDLVLGQGDFTHCTANDDDQNGASDATPSARTFNNPIGLWSDGTRLFVADYGNNRVLGWNSIPTASHTPADFVLGQPDFASSAGGTAADRMIGPNDVGANGNQLAVTESTNNRVLLWNAIPSAATAADGVLGQSDFAHGINNDDDQDGVADATPSARTLAHPVGVEFVRDALMVTDIDNSRMMIFGPLPCPAGQYEPASSPGTCLDDPCQPDPCASGFCRNDTGTATCS